MGTARPHHGFTLEIAALMTESVRALVPFHDPSITRGFISWPPTVVESLLFEKLGKVRQVLDPPFLLQFAMPIGIPIGCIDDVRLETPDHEPGEVPADAATTPADPEAELVAQWRVGDRAAAARLLHRQVEPMRRYFSHRVPCPADAEDLVQQTLLASIDALPRFRGEVGFSHFIRSIASKLLLRYRRDDQRARQRIEHGVSPDVVQASQSSALTWVSREDSIDRLRRAIRSVSTQSARILHLRYWDGHDAAQIGKTLGLRPGAARTRLHRARRELKRVLVEFEGRRASDSNGWPVDDG